MASTKKTKNTSGTVKANLRTPTVWKTYLQPNLKGTTRITNSQNWASSSSSGYADECESSPGTGFSIPPKYVRNTPSLATGSILVSGVRPKWHEAAQMQNDVWEALNPNSNHVYIGFELPIRPVDDDGPATNAKVRPSKLPLRPTPLTRVMAFTSPHALEYFETWANEYREMFGEFYDTHLLPPPTPDYNIPVHVLDGNTVSVSKRQWLWILNNCEHNARYAGGFWFFKTQNDATMFRLTHPE